MTVDYLFLIFQIQTGSRLKRSFSTGSGDRVHYSDNNVTELSEVIESLPDILSKLVVTDIANNNNKKEDPVKDSVMEVNFDSSDEDDMFDPSALGLLDNPGVVRFDSLDYPDSDMYSEDEHDVTDTKDTPTNTLNIISNKLCRFSCDSLVSSNLTQRVLPLKRTKSLSDLQENLDSYLH